MYDYKFWQFVKESIVKHGHVGLLFVAQHTGSSPGKIGFKMAINPSIETFGSIGGGIMELNIIKEFEGHFNNYKSSNNLLFSMKKLYHHKQANIDDQSGLICSGTQTIVFGIISSSELQKVNQIIDNFFVNEINSFEISPKSFKVNLLNNHNKFSIEKMDFIDNKDDFILVENFSIHNHIYIFGGGHVGKEIANVFKNLNFIVDIFDFRKSVFNNISTNKYFKTHFVEDYNSIGSIINESKYSYIVIVNANLIYDIESVASILNKEVRYIGIMGTTTKKEELNKALLKRGFSDEDISKIESPIGLNINSQSPQEIAISIASLIIKIKNKPDNKGKSLRK